MGLDELVERRVEQADSNRASFHCLDDFVEIFFLQRKNVLEVFLALFCRVGNDHLLERSELGLVEEHVLCAAKTNAGGSKAERVFGVLRSVSVGANFKACDFLSAGCCANRSLADFVGPTQELFEVLAQCGGSYRNNSVVNLSC